MDRLLIIGAGGHGRVCAEIAESMGCFREIAFLDDARPLRGFRYQYLGQTPLLDCLVDSWKVFVAIGNATTRENYISKIRKLGGSTPNLVHPFSCISLSAMISKDSGSVFMPGVVINSDAKIGCGVIVNTDASIDHDCVIGDFCHVSVGSHLCGSAILGKGVWIGAGAVVSNNLAICEKAFIAAGAVVVKNIDTLGCYMGVPAKMYEQA